MKKTIIVVFSISAILLAIGAYIKLSSGVSINNIWDTPTLTSGEIWLMSSPPTIIRDSDWSWNEEIQKMIDKFPKPLSISLLPANGPDQVPISNNASHIYFNSGANGSIQISNNSKFVLSGKVGPTIQSIEIINSHDNISRLIEDFRETDFSINLTDMKIGRNIYLLRAYSKNNTIYERFFILYYYPLKTEPEEFQAVKDLTNKNFLQYEQCGPFYEKITSKEKGTYWILMPNQYGKNTQKLKLDDGVNLLYKQQTGLPSENGEFVWLEGTIEFEDEQSNQVYGPLNVSLWCGEFAGHGVRKISDDEYLFSTSWWHEGEPSEYYFNRKKKIFVSINSLIRKIDWDKTYGIFSVEVDKNTIILTESRYCCDDVFSLYGFEKIYFSKDGEFIKRETIARSPIFKTSIKTAQSDSISSKDHGYNLNVFNENETTEHPVTNPKLISDFFIKHSECFEKENGFICGGKIKYDFEIDQNWNARVKNIVKSN